MNEIIAATIGASVSIVLMAISNITQRRERDVRELFARINKLEKEVATLSASPSRRSNWRS
jgi:hypothetical protein